MNALALNTAGHIAEVLQVAEEAGVFEIAPWRSCDVIWRDLGLRLRRLFSETARRLLTEAGYEEVLMPTFIPEDTLQVQAHHYRDVASISFRINGDSDCYLRATSETQFARFVKSKRAQKYPFRMFQICSVFRKEPPERTVPLIRAIEIDPFIETMTFGYSSRGEFDHEQAVYREFFKELCIPTIESQRPVWDTFPEAIRTVAFDAVFDAGSVTQIGSVHDLGTSFARALDLRTAEDRHVEHTSGGISGRAILAMMTLHFSDGKLLLPTSVAPFTVCVTPGVGARFRNLTQTMAGFVRERLCVGSDCPKRVTIPLQVRESLTGGWEIVSAFGQTRRVGLVNGSLGSDIAESMKAYDKELYRRAHERVQRWRDVVREERTCGDLGCLRALALAARQPDILAIEKVSDTKRRCASCGRKSEYLVRLADVFY